MQLYTRLSSIVGFTYARQPLFFALGLCSVPEPANVTNLDWQINQNASLILISAERQRSVQSNFR